MRRSQLATVLGVCLLIAASLHFIRQSRPRLPIDFQSEELAKALPPLSKTSHPIYQIIAEAQHDHENILSRQSDTLAKAVQEYRKRYRIPPPPNFDKWYDFAKARDVQIIDEYDTIYHALLPFWGLSPAVTRSRAKEALGFDNSLLGIIIRDGRVVTAAGGTEWQQKSTVGMLKDFVQFLPSMDLPFNIHDEPRVVVPHDDLSRLVALAKDVHMPPAMANSVLNDRFSTAPEDLGDGTRPFETKTTRFNRYAHQPTWTESRMSCSPESPARALDETIADDHSTFTVSDFGLIANKTAFSDICLSPSLRESYGFFDRPNAFNIVHDLFPIFSQSKISSFQDILYPSPWYWSGKVSYKESDDMAWDRKQNKLYWRGSTTGGFSRDGGWRRQHRQKFVERINGLDTTKTMQRQNNTDGSSTWELQEVPRPTYKDLMDVHFAHVGQCDPGDCKAQAEYFEVVKPEKQHDAWKYKYLLDIDGNAFSGRFYAFLKSTSLVYKMAIFREWHEEWLKPWAHYIPLSMKGDEYVESVRYLDQEEEGQVQAQQIAMNGRNWAGKVLRNEDLEVWLFRLLLEYGRIVDDDRENIGFSI